MNPKLYWLSDAPQGRLAISARPRGGDWLEDEIEGWRKQGVDVVVSLLSPSENEELGLQREAGISQAKAIQFHSLPIEDRGIPTHSAKVEKLAARLASEIDRGKNVAIHCRQGIGRSSLMSAAVLIARGDSVGEALNTIRRARGVEVPETAEQRKWIDEFARLHSSTFARHSR